MTPLEKKALACAPMTREMVEDIYKHAVADSRLRALCVSHERLRAELEGLEILIDEKEKKP